MSKDLCLGNSGVLWGVRSLDRKGKNQCADTRICHPFKSFEVSDVRFPFFFSIYSVGSQRLLGIGLAMLNIFNLRKII